MLFACVPFTVLLAFVSSVWALCVISLSEVELLIFSYTNYLWKTLIFSYVVYSVLGLLDHIKAIN